MRAKKVLFLGIVVSVLLTAALPSCNSGSIDPSEGEGVHHQQELVVKPLNTSGGSETKQEETPMEDEE